MFKFTKKRVGAAVVVGALAIGIPVAYSYWTADGSGEGSASTGTTATITVNQDTFSADDKLYPGGDPVTLSGDFTNQNSGPVYIDHVTVEVDPEWSSSLVDEGLPECDHEDFTIDGSASVTAEIASGVGQGEWSGLTIQFNNKSNENQDNCKNLTEVPLLYTAHAYED